MIKTYDFLSIYGIIKCTKNLQSAHKQKNDIYPFSSCQISQNVFYLTTGIVSVRVKDGIGDMCSFLCLDECPNKTNWKHTCR